MTEGGQDKRKRLIALWGRLDEGNLGSTKSKKARSKALSKSMSRYRGIEKMKRLMRGDA